MAENTNTQGQNLEANPNNGAEQIPQNNEGNNTVVIPQSTESKNNEGNDKVYTQKNLDDAYAKARGTAERETRRKIMAELGLKDDEMDKLSAMKEAYQNSLSDEEKKNQVMEELQADNLKLTQDLEEKDYVIKALIELTGKNEDDVEKIVKMAKGLRTEENTIENNTTENTTSENVVEESTNNNEEDDVNENTIEENEQTGNSENENNTSENITATDSTENEII